ncbi:MAG: hypothetical protein ACTS9Y_00675 [Methylophilus sp.]|uniref:hypothetical protein n=1 Tax=Methylophilus sp. TaxID=29541 RepID=UPI003FA10D8F
MQTHIESKIDACGRVYEIEVNFTNHKPFTVKADTDQGWIVLAKYHTRTEAIKLASARAVMWIEGNHFKVDEPVYETLN